MSSTSLNAPQTFLDSSEMGLSLNESRYGSLGVLDASIVHEVSQPLCAIVTNVGTCIGMLTSDPPDVATALEIVRRIRRDSDRAVAVVVGLRSLFRRESTRKEAMDVNEALRAAVALVSGELRQNRVVVRTELQEFLPPIAGNRLQIQQVILNLVRNASEAMAGVDDRSRELVVRTEVVEQRHVRVSIRDSGVGLGSETNVNRLFEPLYTTKAEGTGIGLFVSRSIIESHGGCLCAVPNDGPGSTFWFSIPRMPDA
jgi:signal transduction histidine kinase